MPPKLISIEEARTRVLAEAFPLSVEVRRISEVLGLVLAEDIFAEHDVPPFANSGMDGFALRAADSVDATQDSPVALTVIQTLAAGHLAERPLRPGEAVKIMTGAPIPDGADAVVQSELAEEDGGSVKIFEPVKPGRNIRRAGEDVGAGDRVLSAGTALGPAEIGVLASLGHPHVQVHRVPRVAILSTGSELVEVDQPLTPGHIRNSNSYSLRAQCKQLGIDAVAVGIVADAYQ